MIKLSTCYISTYINEIEYNCFHKEALNKNNDTAVVIVVVYVVFLIFIK